MPKKILFVENVPDQVEMVGMRLEEEGYEFISAMDGAEGLKKARENRPDLILLDLIMPKLDGLEVCSLLKQAEETKKTPIIVITALDVGDAQEKSFAAGVDDFVTKPYDLEELLAKIKNLLEKKPCL